MLSRIDLGSALVNLGDEVVYAFVRSKKRMAIYIF